MRSLKLFLQTLISLKKQKKKKRSRTNLSAFTWPHGRVLTLNSLQQLVACPHSLLKGQCHDIQWFFCAFLREQNWRLFAQVSRTSDLTARSARGQPRRRRWPATLSESTVDIRQVEQETHCFTCWRRQAAVLFSGYEAQASWYPVLQGSRSAVTALSIWILYSRVLFCALRLFRQSPRREHYVDEEGIGSIFGPFAVTLTMCVSLCRRWKKNEYEEGLSVPTCALALFCGIRTSRWQRLEDSEDALVKTSMDTPHTRRRCSGSYVYVGSVPLCWEVHFWNKNCTSCCPSGDTTMVVPTKEKKNATHHFMKRIFDGRIQSQRRNVQSVKTTVCGWQWVQQLPLSFSTQCKRHNKQLQARLSLKRLPQPAWLPWPRSERGHQPCTARHGFPRSLVVAAIICPHTKWLKKNHWLSRHSRFLTGEHTHRWTK